jgi:hypothetical protein
VSANKVEAGDVECPQAAPQEVPLLLKYAAN